jgi:hypothetical protein
MILFIIVLTLYVDGVRVRQKLRLVMRRRQHLYGIGQSQNRNQQTGNLDPGIHAEVVGFDVSRATAAGRHLPSIRT